MIKTTHGRAALDRWGRFRRFWTVAGDLGIALAAVAMALIFALLLFGAAASLRIPASQAPSPTRALGLPGINPIIPLGYGLVALVIGIVLHELCHGVIARSQGIGVKSLGVLWCVVPVGAFVEQEEAEMLGASRRRRDRVAAAGVLANFGLALLFFAALSAVVAGSVQPNGAGVGVAFVEAGSPAANQSIAPGDIILSINGTATTSATLFESSLAATVPHQGVAVVYRATNGTTVSALVVLATNPSNASRGFLGVAVDPLTPAQLKQTLAAPFAGPFGPLESSVYWLVLPISGLEPVAGTNVALFHLTGPLSALGPGNFWIVANLLYWCAWMNLLLGLSNALPLVPLDGGLLFRDFAASIAARLRRGWDAQRLDAAGGRAVAISSTVVLILLVWQFVVPRLL